jgi:hypothetical protein
MESMRRILLPKIGRILAHGISVLVLTVLPTGLWAQAAPAEKAPADGQAATNAAEMAKPLTPADKKFIKEASESLFFELAIVDVAMRRNRPVGQGRDAAKTLGDRLYPDLQKAWEELSKFAQTKNEKVREELSGAEKRDVEELRAVAIEKFNKEVMVLLGKEGKKLEQIFASKQIQHPILKKIAAIYAPTFKQHVTDIAQAAK